MGMSETYSCLSCGFEVKTWDDGYLYIADRSGGRHYISHPCEQADVRRLLKSELGREPTQEECDFAFRNRTSRERDFLCPDCEALSRIDDSKEGLICSQCLGANVYPIWRCGGRPCPKCGGALSEGRVTSFS